MVGYVLRVAFRIHRVRVVGLRFSLAAEGIVGRAVRISSSFTNFQLGATHWHKIFLLYCTVPGIIKIGGRVSSSFSIAPIDPYVKAHHGSGKINSLFN
jgi:hypothetical protein